MKAVMLSIRPQWCELIANGKKTIEVRKSRPKLETPFKCYIYETRGKTDTPWVGEDGHIDFHGRGQVIGEFACDEIYKISNCSNTFRIPFKDEAFTNQIANWSCLSFGEMQEYLSDCDGCGWRISALQIYDKPRELGEFKRCDECPYGPRERCKEHEFGCDRTYALTRRPQSWGYVEELE